MEDQSSVDWKRLALFFVLSLALFAAWQHFFPTPVPQPQVPPSEEPRVAAPAAEPAQVASASSDTASPPVGEESVRRTVVEVARVRVELTNVGGRITSWQLLDHGEYGTRRGPDGPGEVLEIVKRPLLPETEGTPASVAERRLPIDDQAPFLPLQVMTGDGALDARLRSALHAVSVETVGAETTATLRWSDGQGTAVEKKLTFTPDSPLVRLEAKLVVEGRAVPFEIGWGPGIGNPTDAELGNAYFRRGEAVYHAGGKVRRAAQPKDAAELPGSVVDWAGIEESFFAVVFVPAATGGADAGANTGFRVGGEPPPRPGGKKPRRKDWPDHLVVSAPFDATHATQSLYVGPRSRPVLEGIDASSARPLHLGELAKTGLLDPIAVGMRWLLLWFHERTASWGIAILLLTLAIRIAMFPLTHVSLKRMRLLQDRMQVVKPKQDALKEKFRKLPRTMENRQREQQELMELYATQGIKPGEPLMGCLPMLLSMPFFMALFYMLPREILLRQEPFAWWSDLSLSDPSHVLPILSGLTTFVSSKFSSGSSASMDPMQKNMLLLFPLMFTYICWDAPLALVVYWTASNVIQIGQQYLLKLTLPSTSAAPTTDSSKKRGARQDEAGSPTPAGAIDRSPAVPKAPAEGAKKRRKR